jgi:hypothetical protein
MKKRFLVLSGAIAVFFAGSLTFVHWATRAGGPPRASPVPFTDVPAPPAAPVERPAAVPAPLSTPAVVLPPDAPALAEKRPRPAWLVGSTRRLGPQPDPTPLGPLRPYVASGLARLQVAVAGCAAEAPPHGSAAVKHGRATLTLHLESQDNQLRIAEATLAGGDGAEDWRVECARRKLRGQVIQAPAKAGTHLEVPFVLNL